MKAQPIFKNVHWRNFTKESIQIVRLVLFLFLMIPAIKYQSYQICAFSILPVDTEMRNNAR